MAGYLIAEEGPLAGLVVRFEEGEEWVLGRDPDEVSIVLEDPMVSRKHVICRLTAEGFILENLSSVNPATQNGKVITEPVLLREGDILQIGSTFFHFSEKIPHVSGEPYEETPPPIEAEMIEDQEDLSSVNVEAGEDVRWLLKVISGPNSGAEFAVHAGSTYILGKDPNLCDIVFQDLSVSRQHARLIVDEDNQIFIEDLGSRNGVLVNGELTLEKRLISSQDLVSLGTTSFLMIDREQIHETIISPPSTVPTRVEEELPPAVVPAAEIVAEKPDWKEIVIPKKHIILAGFFALALIAGLASMMALFKTENVVVAMPDESEMIAKTLAAFEDVQFSFNPANGKIFLVGHVLTSIDKQELLYKIQNLFFVKSIDDNVIVDELVWENTNALLMTNANWIGVSLYSPAPGKFVLRGYIDTLDQAQALSDYINLNFPYLDRLENQVVVETNLQAQIQSLLVTKGFSGVTFQLSNGELVLAGRVDQKHSHAFTEMVDQFKSLRGVRMVKNFVIFTTADTSRIDISAQYQVSGYSKKDDQNKFIVINGKILSVGDAIDGMMITGILPNMVLLEKDGLKFRINYNLQ